jgi:hypothetical protein
MTGSEQGGKRRASKAWSTTRGPHGYSVQAKEAGGAGGIVKLHWYENLSRRTASLGFRIRDDRGRVVANLKREAIRAAEEKVLELQTGGEQNETSAMPAPGPVTLEEGIDRFFRIPDGYFPKETEDVRYLKKLGSEIVRALGRDRRWDRIGPESVTRELIRKLADKNRKAGTTYFRKTERTVDLLHKVGRWLKEERFIQDWEAPSKWKERLQAEWDAIIGSPAPSPRRERFSIEDLAALVAAHDHPELHPKAALLFDLTWGRRIQQVKKLKRSMVVLEPDGSVMVSVPGTTRKHAGTMELSSFQRDRLLAAFSEGYLADLEAAHQKGALADYAIFPQGELRNGVAPLANASKPCDDTFVSEQFRRLEELAGVEHRHHRGFRGVRRTLADVNEGFSKDPKVLDHEGSWAPSGVRQRIYQDQESRTIMSAGARLRERVRRYLLATANGESEGESVVSEVEDLLSTAPIDPETLSQIMGLLRSGQMSDEGGPSGANA